MAPQERRGSNDGLAKLSKCPVRPAPRFLGDATGNFLALEAHAAALGRRPGIPGFPPFHASPPIQAQTGHNCLSRSAVRISIFMYWFSCPEGFMGRRSETFKDGGLAGPRAELGCNCERGSQRGVGGRRDPLTRNTFYLDSRFRSRGCGFLQGRAPRSNGMR